MVFQQDFGWTWCFRMCLWNTLTIFDKYELFLQLGQFSMCRAEAFLSNFGLKTAFATITERDFST